jgi:hypothetical protein
VRDVLCWDPDRVGSVINIDADFVPDEVFRAVHVDTPLHVRGAAEDSPYRPLAPSELLAEFLDPIRNHFQLAVLGQTGAGKSHLIRWMRQHIENDDRRAVVTVHRLETNLRAILDKLVGELPKDRRHRFREELDQAGVMLRTREGQKESLLNNLSVAIRQDRAQDNSGLDRQTEEFFLENLPNLLLDPQLRRDKFLQEGEVIDELVDRLFSTRAGRREAERIEFTRDNLPLRNIDIARASAIARDALEGLLYDQDRTVPAALAIVNRNLGDAISLSMNFSGDRLAELMGELRKSLAQQGKELVLLFEEFARFQGYDGALLGALLVQGGDGLCNIRWAIACTSGFYKGLPDTARTRMTAIIDMDHSQTGGEDAERRRIRFAGRYLNAVRVGREELKRAYDGDDREHAPNKCDGCEHRRPCHKAFGASDDGYGLYPLTPRAVEIMSERAAERESPDDPHRFNPRAFQRGVLLPVLTDGGAAIASHMFPNGALHQSFGGVSRDVPPMHRERLQEKYGRDAERYVALLDLWSGSVSGEGLSPEVFQAFGLEPVFEAPEPPEPEGRRKRKPPQDEPQAQPIPPEIQEIRAWPGGGSLSQALSEKLRSQLFKQIIRTIDWDGLGLERSKFAGATGAARPFRQLSLVFERQETRRTPAVPVQFTLPFDHGDERDFNRTATALEGLLEVERYGGWNFPDAEEKLICLLDLTERCAIEVARQLGALEGDRAAWDPVAGAMELLAVTAALSGTLPTGEANAETILDRCFRAPVDGIRSHQDDGLRKLYERLRGQHARLVEFVRAHCSGTKGGQSGRFLNPRRPLAALQEFLARDWRLERRPQRLETDFYKQVGDLYEHIASSLSEAVDRERSLRSEWLARVGGAFGPDPSMEAIVEGVQKPLATVQDFGLPVRSIGNLAPLIEQFKSAPFARTAGDARALVLASPAVAVLSCGRGDAETAALVDQLIAGLQMVLQDAGNELTARERSVGSAGGDRIERAATRMITSLGRLSEDLARLQGWSNVD